MSYWNGLLVECSLTPTTGKYQGITAHFPVESCETTFSQDIAIHKKPMVPGARVESTGRNPTMFKVKAPMIAGLQRGSGETWSDLFPTMFLLMMRILNDDISPSCVFVHPTLGTFAVKPVSGSTATTTEVRNGQILDFELIEAIPDQSNQDSLSQTDKAGLANTSATIFDNQAANPLTPDAIKLLLQGTPSMQSIMASINGIINNTTLFVNSSTAQITNGIQQVQQIDDSLNSLDSASTIGMTMQLERIKYGIYGLAYKGANILTYNVPTEMTLSQVAANLQVTVDTIINLNPGQPSTLVPAGTAILYPSS